MQVPGCAAGVCDIKFNDRASRAEIPARPRFSGLSRAFPINPGYSRFVRISVSNNTRVAANRARAKAVEVDAAFQKAKLGLPSELTTASKVAISQLETAARLYLYDQERAHRGSTPDENDQMDASEMLTYLGSDYEAWAGMIHKLAEELADNYKLPIKPGDKNWLEFIDLLHRAEVEHQHRRLDRARHLRSFKTHDKFFEEVYDGAARPNIQVLTANTLGDVINRFESDPHRKHLTESAGKKYIIPLAALREVVGDEIPISAITRAQCAETIDIIARLPSNYTKYREFKGKTLRDISLISEESGRKLLARGTVEVYAHHLSAFFNFALQKGLCETNPATRLTPKGVNSEGGRVPFLPDELQRMINGLPEWCDWERNGRFWVPMIALYSGMRIGEIIWLTQEDLQIDSGHHVFVLTRTTDRSLKTPGSARKIPIHSTLIYLGILSLMT
ncbi:hypothetical protein [Rhizobium alvei]|uniref:Tyr recombinase domain-containing protein n=1 Tax=Rhizobium alvei TaxID=1132659 RepID=A0ABT8YTL8_9HYPH|nr:hypothetical protein [Rhizobium alvei]MDO6967034.1 hypothetical protein [Rhizobium alvei]